jgi:hypothetical protein
MHRRYTKPNLVYRILEKASKLVDHLILHKRYLLGMLIFTVLFFFIAIRFKRMFFTFFLIALGSVSMMYQRYFEFSKYIGLELCMMSTVLVALAYGPAFGAFTGFATIFLALIISGNFKHSSFISILALPLVGFSVQFFRDMPLLYVGILMTIIYDALVLPLYVLLGSRVVSSIIFFITHLMINIWIFTTIAPFLYSFMA